MKIKRFKDIFESDEVSNKHKLNRMKRENLKKHEEYISDVFVRLEDAGQYKVEIKPTFWETATLWKDWENKDSYKIMVRILFYDPDLRTSKDLIMDNFKSIEEYIKFNDIMKRILEQLLHDYYIHYFNIGSGGKTYVITLESKNETIGK